MDSAPYPWQEVLWQTWKKMQVQAGVYLLEAQRGLGALALAEQMALFVLSRSTTKQVVKACVQAGTHPDYAYITRAAGIDRVREVMASVQGTAFWGVKVVLVELIETLGVPAQQALLKALEDLPEQTVWILVTEQKDRLLPALLSRCQGLYLKKPEFKQAQGYVLAAASEQQKEPPQPQLVESVLFLAGGAPLKALDWLAQAPQWQQWVDCFLGTHPFSILSIEQDQAQNFLNLWQMVVMDLLYHLLGQEKRVILKKEATQVAALSKRWTPFRAQAWLQKLAQARKMQAQSFVNLRWMIQALGLEWKQTCS